MPPKITVLMSVYNGEKYLSQAIESILNQTFSDFEFLIINDCSTDDSKNIILSYIDSRIKYIENEQNIGLTKSLNKGIDLARGEYIARMDADDMALPERLEKQYNYLKDHPDLTFLGCWANFIDKKGEKSGLFKRESNYSQILASIFIKNSFIHSTILCEKEALTNVGGYDESILKSQDYRLWLDLLFKGYKGINLPHVLQHYRIHDNSISNQDKNEQDYYAALSIKKSLENNFNIKITLSRIKTIRKSLVNKTKINLIEILTCLFTFRKIYRLYSLKFNHNKEMLGYVRGHIYTFIDSCRIPFLRTLFVKFVFFNIPIF